MSKRALELSISLLLAIEVNFTNKIYELTKYVSRFRQCLSMATL